MPDVSPARIPRHIAVIMDGNGRWAEERGFPRIFGHRAGASAVREIIAGCVKVGVEVLTLYSFSSENWRRPSEEVEALMRLCVAYCQGEQDELKRNNIRVRVIGRREGMPSDVLGALDTLCAATADCTGLTLCLAINYGSRDEILDAVRVLAGRVARGELSADGITHDVFEACLDTAGLPDPDLLIRTGGEMRLSNYLLWQLSYAELYVIPDHWPDFNEAALYGAIRAYAQRQRRFGGLDSDAP
ncbi:MAG: isoprenyl transferase [Planctomycetota bacterium]|nr:MAG: isoprenyl transferase [Planctomycetota bacterium]